MDAAMSTTVQAPCGHEVSTSSPHCDWCVADFLERRGHHIGRAGLTGVSAGLAFDVSADGRVTAYMLHADVVAFDSGGFFDSWMASDEQVAVAPHVVVAEPTFPVAMPTQELADFCELVSEWATLLLPSVDWAIKHDQPQALYLELASWLDAQRIGPNGARFVLHVVHLLARALMQIERSDC